MIITYNVCDNCGSQNKITSGSADSGVTIEFSLLPAYETRLSFSTPYTAKTFCNKACLMTFFTGAINHDGVMEKEEDD